jgi:hypothetical protein
MSYRIGLYEGSTRQGKIELDTLFVMERADYVCEPRGVLTDEEVRQIAKTLRRAPDIHAGVVGRYDWREEQPPGWDDRVAMTRKAIQEGIPLNRIEQELDWLDYLSETLHPGHETDRRSGCRPGVGRHGKSFREKRNVSRTPDRPWEGLPRRQIGCPTCR